MTTISGQAATIKALRDELNNARVLYGEMAIENTKLRKACRAALDLVLKHQGEELGTFEDFAELLDTLRDALGEPHPKVIR
jgi:hypothetical protein